MTQFSDRLLDGLLAPGISAFDYAEVPELGVDCEQANHWLANHFLNSLFGHAYSPRSRQTVMTFLFRTQIAVQAYRAARVATLDCVRLFSPGSPASGRYFAAISEWERVLLNSQIAIDVFVKVIAPDMVLPEEVDRIRKAANRIKHYADDICRDQNSVDLTLPIWLSSDRLHTRTCTITFEEIAQQLREMGKAANHIQNPNAVVQDQC